MKQKKFNVKNFELSFELMSKLLLMHWHQPQSTPCEGLPPSGMELSWQSSQSCGHPCLWILSHHVIFFFPQPGFHWYALTQHRPASLFSTGLLWFALVMEGCQSADFPVIVVAWTERDQEMHLICTIWTIICSNWNWNIVVVWDGGFLIFMSCKAIMIKIKTKEAWNFFPCIFFFKHEWLSRRELKCKPFWP